MPVADATKPDEAAITAASPSDVTDVRWWRETQPERFGPEERRRWARCSCELCVEEGRL